MITFRTFLSEEKLFENFYLNLLMEEAAEKKSGTGQAADTKGKLHELLVGYHLGGGKHMLKHTDEEGDTPEQAHEQLKQKVTPEEYNKINARAKAAAADIKSKVESGGGKIQDIHWTSKPGDIERTTGIKSSQKEDQSDIIVNTADKKGNIKHHGVSLKVSDGTSKHVPVSNAGKEALHPEFEKERQDHIEKMYNTFKGLSGLSNKEKRKEWLNQDPDRKEQIKDMNLSFLKSATANAAKHIQGMGQHEMIDHIKKQVLQANPTPMQKQGHEHIRHTTYQAGKREGGGFKFDSHTPSEHYQQYFDGSHHIHAEPVGTQIHFTATNKATGEKKRIATQRLKLNSGSDPLSSIKSSGIAAD